MSLQLSKEPSAGDQGVLTSLAKLLKKALTPGAAFNEPYCARVGKRSDSVPARPCGVFPFHRHRPGVHSHSLPASPVESCLPLVGCISPVARWAELGLFEDPFGCCLPHAVGWFRCPGRLCTHRTRGFRHGPLQAVLTARPCDCLLLWVWSSWSTGCLLFSL